MCDFAAKLMAWLDDELPAYEAAAVQQHLPLCHECRRQVEAYRLMSRAFDRYCHAYCEAAAAPEVHRGLPKRLRIVSGAAAVAAAVTVFFWFAPRTRVQPLHVPAVPPMPSPFDAAKALPPARAEQPAAAVNQPVSRTVRREPSKHVRPAFAQTQNQQTGSLSSDAAVEIAIPADAVFPPGAVPEGIGFTADVTIAPDGSAQQIRVRPQLTEFERRPTRP
jgi:anti-sigma factor RsiW